jgi:Co/Zn/Cd efflux system component
VESAGTKVASDTRHVVPLVALLNVGYIGIGFTVALAIGSVSLFTDSIDLRA